MKSRIPQSFIKDLIERTDIVPLIGERVQIKKAGQNYQGRCPFHDEKTPSFTVSEPKQFYYCFGCGAHGNAISFLMEYDRMEFREAVEYLAAQQGLAIPIESGEHNPEEYKRRQASFETLKKVSHFYEQQLKTSHSAIRYLKSRGLTGRIAKHFILGFSPDGWENLKSACDNQALLVENGLLIEPKNYARFRNRIMYPIRNTRGQVIAFGGRALSDDDKPKYMNSPETPVFHKSNELYGLYEALKASRHLSFALVVEGYMDVIALHQYGFPQAVATLGTAVNTKHIQKLLRHTNEIVFCFDGDNAGQQAAWKALTIAMPLLRDGIQFRFLFLPPKEDPDSLIRRIGKNGFAQRLKTAEPLSEVFFKLLKQQMPIDTLDDKTRFANEANQYIRSMPHGLYHELLLRRMAELLGLYRADLDHLASSEKNQNQKPIHDNPPVEQCPPLVRKLLRMLLQQPKLASEASPDETSKAHIPGSKLLRWTMHRLQTQLTDNIGQLLAELPENSPHQHFLAECASQPLKLDDTSLRTEFLDGIIQLHQLECDQRYQDLQAIARQGALSPEERQELNSLLVKAPKDPI